MKKSMKKAFVLSLSLLTSLAIAVNLNTLKVDASEEDSSDETAVALEILPVAKYEFSDATNPGKDSMGNFDLNTKGTINVSDGAATFDSSNAMIENGKDISNKLTSFSLVFDIKNGTGWTNWAEPIGFGWDDWNATNWCVFNFESGSNLLRFTTAVDGTAADGNVNPYYGKEIGNISTTEFQRVILSVDTTGLIDVYLNGTRKYSYDAPSNFNLKNSNMHLALGQNGSWGNPDRNPWNGQLKNVAIYPTAFNEIMANSYSTNGKITTADLPEGTRYITTMNESDPVYKGNITTADLYDNMSTEDMFALVNQEAEPAIRSNNKVLTLPVTWTRVEENDGVYTLIGSASATIDDKMACLTTVKLGTYEVRKVLDVKEYVENPAVDPVGPSDDPSDIPSESPSEVPSDVPSEIISETPSNSVSNDATSDEPIKRGCKGSVGMTLFGLITLAGTALVLKKKH